MSATIIQIVGILLVVTGLSMLSVPAAIMLAGAATLAFGIAAERRD